jgi:hypothetical protein
VLAIALFFLLILDLGLTVVIVVVEFNFLNPDLAAAVVLNF